MLTGVARQRLRQRACLLRRVDPAGGGQAARGLVGGQAACSCLSCCPAPLLFLLPPSLCLPAPAAPGLVEVKGAGGVAAGALARVAAVCGRGDGARGSGGRVGCIGCAAAGCTPWEAWPAAQQSSEAASVAGGVRMRPRTQQVVNVVLGGPVAPRVADGRDRQLSVRGLPPMGMVGGAGTGGCAAGACSSGAARTSPPLPPAEQARLVGAGPALGQGGPVKGHDVGVAKVAAGRGRGRCNRRTLKTGAARLACGRAAAA